MLYIQSTHPVVAVGQVWRSTLPTGVTAVVVAVDRGPSGFVINVVLEDGREINGVRQVLAPIGWEHLEAHLGEVISDHADVSPHLASYEEWKEMAQVGKSGYWTCTPEDVLAAVRNALNADQPEASGTQPPNPTL